MLARIATERLLRVVVRALCPILALTLLRVCPVQAQWQRDGVPVCTAAGNQTAPVVVRSGGGGFVIWEDARTTPSRIFAQRLSGAGETMWTSGGIEVATRSGRQQGPVAVGDAVGGVIIAWVQDVNGFADVYAQRLDGSGARLWAADGVPVCTAAGAQSGLAIISDNRQPLVEPPGAIIAWTDGRVGSDTDIYAQAISAAGVPRWQVNGVGVCVLSGVQDEVAMVTDGTGLLSNPKGAIFAWRDERSGDADIYSQRLNAGGTPQWITNGVAVATGQVEQRGPRLLFVGSASAVIAWEDARGMNRSFTIYAQKVANNAVSWTQDGVLVCSIGSGQTRPAIVSDGAGGTFIAWRDARDFFNPVVAMQRLDPAGVQLWAPDGLVVSAVPRSGNPALVSAGPSSAVAVWPDSRADTNGDVFAQKVNAGGDIQWRADDVPVCLATGIQTEIHAAPDSTAGAIVAWTDYRNGAADIYVNRVTGDGTAVAVHGQAPPHPSFSLSAPVPNPSAGFFFLDLDLPAATTVTARVYDVHGRLIATPARERSFPAGRHVLRCGVWSAEGRRVPAGIYLVRVEAGREEATRRVVITD